MLCWINPDSIKDIINS